MTVKGMASLYAAGKLRGDRDAFSDPSVTRNTFHADHKGVYLRMHSAAPPPVEEYEAWLAANPVGKKGKSPVTGTKLRRMVVMRRNGCSLTEITRAVGMTAASAAKRWLDLLPSGLSA